MTQSPPPDWLDEAAEELEREGLLKITGKGTPDEQWQLIEPQATEYILRHYSEN